MEKLRADFNRVIRVNQRSINQPMTTICYGPGRGRPHLDNRKDAKHHITMLLNSRIYKTSQPRLCAYALRKSEMDKLREENIGLIQKLQQMTQMSNSFQHPSEEHNDNQQLIGIMKAFIIYIPLILEKLHALSEAKEQNVNLQIERDKLILEMNELREQYDEELNAAKEQREEFETKLRLSTHTQDEAQQRIEP